MAGIGAIGGAIAQPIAAHFAQKRQHKYVKQYMKNKYQWEVADLIAAGLNPILGYTKGGPAIGSVGIPNIAGGQGATAIGAMKLKAELALLRSSARKLDAEAGRAVAQTGKVELEVKEFKPTIGGVARRIFESERTKKFIRSFGQGVGDLPSWIRNRLQNAAEK